MTGVFDDHLSLDAVVAYADGEMSLTAYQRAAAHLVRCGPCAADVAEQTAASQYLRGARVPTMPSSLFAALTSIPVAAPVAPGAAQNLSPNTTCPDATSPGSTSSRSIPASSTSPSVTSPGSTSASSTPLVRRLRLGAGALVAGIAVGAVMVTAAGDAPVEPAGPPQPGRTAVSDPSVPTPAWVLRTTVINVLGRSTSTTR